MIDDFEARVGVDLRRLALPATPNELRSRVLEIPAAGASPRRRATSRPRHWTLVAAVVAALVTIVGIVVLSGGSQSITPGPSASPRPSDPIASLATPTTVDGLPVLSISEAIAKRDAGGLGQTKVAVRGFWSDGSVAHSCAAPLGRTGDLEIYCHDREWGMTELDEPIVVISREGYMTEGVGPWLTPYIPNELTGIEALFSLPIINGQRFPPVPIVVVGHFNDPRAADCRPDARKVCENRLVVDRIAAFDPGVVPTPAPTPSPTPFPIADPPPAPFTVESCLEKQPAGFVGWQILSDLGIERGYPGEYAFTVVSKGPFLVRDWWNDPNDGKRYRTWGKRICFAYERDIGGVGVDVIPGTAYREYPDGHTEPTEGP